MGFTIHFYIIFGTNLLTQSPVPVPVFFLVSVFRRKNIKQRRNGMKPSGEVIFGRKATRETWSPRQESNEEGTRQGARPPPWAPRSSTDLLIPPIYIYIYISIYPENIQEHHETLFPPPQPSLPVRSHLGAFSGAPPEEESIMEGLYINTMASPMMCE